MNLKEIMEFNSPYNNDNLTKLIEKIKSNSIVPYIGAGMSMLFDNVYPSWDAFLSNTYDKYISNGEKSEYKSLSYEEKADFLYSKIGKITFAEHLKETFGQKHLTENDVNFIDKSIYMLPIIFKNNLILTTNYDNVIEKMYALHKKNITVSHPGHFEELNIALRDCELLLFKIHGDILAPSSSIILTSDQYDIAYEDSNLIQSLSQIYKSKELLFLGCSMVKDRPIELLRANLTDGMKNYAVIPCKKNDIESRRLQLEEDLSTQAIIYPDGEHGCLNILLNHIAVTVNPQDYHRISSKYNDKRFKEKKLNLSNEWFVTQNIEQIKNLGSRYLPDLNVELHLKKIFDALSRNKDFSVRFDEMADKLLIELNQPEFKCLKKNIDKIYNFIKLFNSDKINNLNVEEILKELKSIYSELIKNLNDNYKKLEDKSNKDKVKDNIYKLNRAISLLDDYTSYMESKEIYAVNNPYILLHGEGGIGKSHLIADMIMKRNSEGKKSLLFLGQHFKDKSNPLTEILRILEIDCLTEEFLKELNRIAEIDKSKIVIFIDALNEGDGKKIWKNYLAEIVNKFKRYSWLGLVISIRTEYVDTLFNDNSLLKNEFINVRHQGFSTLEYQAIKKYFNFYNIQFNSMPFAEQEFRNPLFLRLLCEGFKNSTIDLSHINISKVYKNYLSSINLRISEICEYSRHYNIVEIVINKMVLYKYNVGTGNNFIPLYSAIKIITDIEKDYNIKKTSLFDELISNGILTKNINYNNEEFIYITYEKLEDYLYAKLLVAELNQIGIDKFYNKYKKLQAYEDILEALAIVLSENSKLELFEIFNIEKNHSNIISSFCNSLKWRRSDTITKVTYEYINNVVLKSGYGFEKLFNVLILISSKIGHNFNAEKTVDYIINHTMPNRDQIFITLFDSLYYEEGSSINRLLDWSLLSNVKENTLKETIRLTAMTMVTFLISPNNVLRDKTTKALVNLLSGNIDILILILEKYKTIDDPYVIERLYAVSLGCIISEQQNDKIEALALYVYNNIFNKEYVYPNMLIRDYAKNIIEYAKYKLPNSKLINFNVQPPYKSEMPNVPSDEEIDKYKYNYKKADFKDYYWSQNAILNSMEVEYSRDGSSGGYGDFGRYTFQRYFSDWDGLDYNDLKNIAIKKIFNMGYDVEKHGHYDRQITNARSRENISERIGKKYQWIALYELAAQVADNYKMQVHTDCYGGQEEIYCKGSFEPNLRNIDPTSLIVVHNEDNKEIHNKLFVFPSITNGKWLSNFDDLPNINDIIQLKYKNQNYILLNGQYVWTEERELGVKQYENPQKDIWIQINGYIVRSEDYSNAINKLKNQDFIGRWLSEPRHNYALFNKEYYWSDAYNFYKNPYYGGGDSWEDINTDSRKEIENIEILLPTTRYMTERRGDIFNDNNFASWYKPSADLFIGLDMKYGKENSVLYNSNNEIICFDSIELLNEDIGFFINFQSFIKYLKERNYKFFWTILAEKRIMKKNYDFKSKARMPRISGLITIDENGKLAANTKMFED